MPLRLRGRDPDGHFARGEKLHDVDGIEHIALIALLAVDLHVALFLNDALDFVAP